MSKGTENQDPNARVTMSVVVSADLKRRLEEAAERTNRKSVSNLVETLLMKIDLESMSA